jgi:hypothetical protein
LGAGTGAGVAEVLVVTTDGGAGAGGGFVEVLVLATETVGGAGGGAVRVEAPQPASAIAAVTNAARTRRTTAPTVARPRAPAPAPAR